MRQSEQKVLQYLDRAHTSELAQARVLQSQILMTPRGRYRSALEAHLKETRGHAKRLGRRKEELGRGHEPLTAIVGFASAFSQLMALGKTPLEVIRGSGGEEKVLENAKDAYASEALEIATYTALEQLARAAGDDASASLAESIRTEEEKMLERVLREIPHLTDAVARAELEGENSYELTNTGAADAIREVGESVGGSAGTVQSRARRTARKAQRASVKGSAPDRPASKLTSRAQTSNASSGRE
jgi:ferritin-like metal-binding protein YciE